MARIITIEELMNTEEAIGWLEEFYEADEEEAEHTTIFAVAYDNKYTGFVHGSGFITYDNYNVKEDGGYRIWDSKPTEEEMKNAVWEVR